MFDAIFVSDFDGTITKRDTLATFLGQFASFRWEDVEQDWRCGKITSQQCLKQQFALVPNLSQKLIDDFLKTVEIDDYFIEFYEKMAELDIPIVILSDGLDYFINRVLKKYGLNSIQVITNRAYFSPDGEFVMEFPNKSCECTNGAGTCKCSVVKNLKKKYKNVYYIGDGASDFCVSKLPDLLFAKANLSFYCVENQIDFIHYNNFKEVLEHDRFRNIRSDFR